MSSAMLRVKGRLQREGIVIHVIAESIHDQTELLRTVGNRDFTHRTGPGDGARHGGPDPRHPIRLPTRNFR